MPAQSWTRVERRYQVQRYYWHVTGRDLADEVTIPRDAAVLDLLASAMALPNSDAPLAGDEFAKLDHADEAVQTIEDYLGLGDDEFALVLATLAHGVLVPLALLGALQVLCAHMVEVAGSTDQRLSSSAVLAAALTERDELGGRRPSSTWLGGSGAAAEGAAGLHADDGCLELAEELVEGQAAPCALGRPLGAGV